MRSSLRRSGFIFFRRLLLGAIGVTAWGVAVVSAADDEERAPVNPAFRRPDFNQFHAGRYVYERHCQICHGPEGDGKGELGLTLPVKPRSFVQGLFKYRSTPPGKLPTDADLKRTITGGLTGTAMGMFTMLSAPELDAVIEYVKFFSRRWRKPENFAEPLEFPEPPAWLRRADEAKFRAHAAAGRKLYDSTCVACHGPKGDGKGIAAAGLMDAWGFPSAPADLRQPHLRCGGDPRDLYRVLTTGLDGTPMVSFAEVFTPEQRWDLAAFILSLRPAGGS